MDEETHAQRRALPGLVRCLVHCCSCRTLYEEVFRATWLGSGVGGAEFFTKVCGLLIFCFLLLFGHIKCFLMQESRSNPLSQSGSCRLCRITTEKGRLSLAESKAEELVPREYENRSARLCSARQMRS